MPVVPVDQRELGSVEALERDAGDVVRRVHVFGVVPKASVVTVKANRCTGQRLGQIVVELSTGVDLGADVLSADVDSVFSPIDGKGLRLLQLLRSAACEEEQKEPEQKCVVAHVLVCCRELRRRKTL